MAEPNNKDLVDAANRLAEQASKDGFHPEDSKGGHASAEQEVITNKEKDAIIGS